MSTPWSAFRGSPWVSLVESLDAPACQRHLFPGSAVGLARSVHVEDRGSDVCLGTVKYGRESGVRWSPIPQEHLLSPRLYLSDSPGRSSQFGYKSIGLVSSSIRVRRMAAAGSSCGLRKILFELPVPRFYAHGILGLC